MDVALGAENSLHTNKKWTWYGSSVIAEVSLGGTESQTHCPSCLQPSPMQCVAGCGGTGAGAPGGGTTRPQSSRAALEPAPSPSSPAISPIAGAGFAFACAGPVRRCCESRVSAFPYATWKLHWERVGCFEGVQAALVVFRAAPVSQGAVGSLSNTKSKVHLCFPAMKCNSRGKTVTRP